MFIFFYCQLLKEIPDTAGVPPPQSVRTCGDAGPWRKESEARG
jgi:hypothetical protein